MNEQDTLLTVFSGTFVSLEKNITSIIVPFTGDNDIKKYYFVVKKDNGVYVKTVTESEISDL